LNLGFEYDVRRAAEAPWLWAVAPSFLLDTALARRLRREIATGGLRAAQLDYVEAVWAVRRELRAALLAAVIGERRRAQLGAIVDDRSELLRLLEARVAAGESGSGERLQSALELTRARAAMADAQRAVADARARMAGVIGVPPSALDDQALRWEDLDAPQLPDAAQLRRQREQALLSRTDLARAIVDYDTRERELHEQVRLQYPQFSAGPGYMYDHGIRKATASVSFNLPLFNHNQGPIAEADARRESAGRHLLAVQAQILNEVDSSWNAYRSALEALSAATEQTMSAQRLLQQTQRSFDLGAEDRATLLAARLTQAAQSLLQLDALERAQQALGQLEDALRTPLYGPELHLDNPRGDNLQ
jgi:outer membrane protein TolC